ncbi:hypothetical protein J1605_004920 [Eschrichtius robustus]|uniref:Small ribosomal subunit protein uS2 C-terminal domain-containing protein n=1 Tax=Eschrichtius robustus TaxID=9764 RepID=A0AB34HCE3_ESCRO|nr:hypothetical protein J1605_004920 [Eschrichtius robustus]
MRDTISREQPWEVVPDLCFYRDPEEIEKEEQVTAKKAVTKEEFQSEWSVPDPELTASQPEVADWSECVQVPSVPIQPFPTEDWSAQPATEDWSAAPTAQATEWITYSKADVNFCYTKSIKNLLTRSDSTSESRFIPLPGCDNMSVTLSDCSSEFWLLNLDP